MIIIIMWSVDLLLGNGSDLTSNFESNNRLNVKTIQFSKPWYTAGH